MGALIRKIIRVYQRVLSPMLGAHCRFYPSCSEYAYQCYQRFGFFRATGKTLGRIGRCHPFHPGGFDPVTPNLRNHSPGERLPSR